MRKQIESLYHKFFGQEVFIVGGGYSIKGMNIDYLHDKNTIAVNDAYKILPNATALFWCDTSWCGRELDGLKAHKAEHRFQARFHANVVDESIVVCGGASLLRRSGTHGYDPNIDHVMGNNSGTHSLNFAVNLGAKRIYLVGFDMKLDPHTNETHWHNHHSLVVRPGIYSKSFVPSITALGKGIRDANIDVEIINCSKTSAIQCFKKQTVPGLVKKQ